MFENFPLRHPLNDKLRIYYDHRYRGYNVWQEKNGPLIENYLERAYQILHRTTEINTRTFAFRVDLRFPGKMPRLPMHDDNKVLESFFRFFRRELILADTKYTTQLRHLWAREQANSIKPHYHLMILLNKSAFDTVGMLPPDRQGIYSRNNLYHRMMRSWLKAMGFHNDESRFPGLINVSKKPVSGERWSCILRKDDQHSMNDAMYMASYLCKAYSKPFAQGGHVFDGSRF